jgi:uroporphyrinogen-III decarboxylase
MMMGCLQDGLAMGFPPYGGGMASAPYDYFADYLRGTSGITMDMYRRPDKLLEAMERMVPLIIESAVAGAKNAISPLVIMPLHKGDDVFMSDKQFETFYWPTLKKVLLGLINEGLVPAPIADGSYNRRLEVIRDLPRAGTFWIFEKTDMDRAKKILGNTACLGGNVSASQLCLSRRDEVKAYCRWLIEVCGKNGGYILTPGASVDKGNPENMHALVESAREYGRYRR